MSAPSKRNLKKRCGCAKRTWETCAHPWFFTFQWKGKVGRGSLGASKRDDAVQRFTEVKAAIMNGTYVRPKQQVAAVVHDQPTFEAVAGFYLAQHVESKLSDRSVAHHNSIVKFLGAVTIPPGIAFTAKPFRSITQEDIEIARAAKTRKVAANRMLGHLSALWNWATQPKRAYADKSPFSHGGRVPDELKKTKERGRSQRLKPGQEAALLEHAGPHLHDVIVTAIETGMRKGEILSLQWRHVKWLQNEIAVEWQNTKTKQSREIPISPAMREILTARLKTHPKDKPWKPEHHVFGDAVGDQIKNISTAWDNCVLKADGVKLVRGHAGRVSPENRARLHQIDLHFHDLRHEAGSRKLEAGWPLHAVSRWLGHTKLTTTDTYLNATTRLLHELNERVPLTLVR